MTAIRLGVIGAGIMGERMLRAAVEHAADTVHIAGVWDPSPAAQARITAGLPGLSLATSAEALIAASDCVYIASPPASHLSLSAAVLAAGKAVFCEKPLASDVAAAAAFVASARGKRAAVNFPMATSFAAERLRGWLAEGVIGTPQRLDIAVAFANWPRGWQRDALWRRQTAQRTCRRAVHRRDRLRPPAPRRRPAACCRSPGGDRARRAPCRRGRRNLHLRRRRSRHGREPRLRRAAGP